MLNLASAYGADFAHVEHVARLALELWDALGRAGLHACDPLERDLLWSAAMLHDIGTAVDYDDHHKHSRYLILSAGLPGYSPRETGLIGQLARYHRKGSPGLGEFSALARDGDEALVERCAAVLRLAEQLERPRDQTVEGRRRRRRWTGTSPCACGTPRTSPSPAGRPSASASCSRRRSGASWRIVD